MDLIAREILKRELAEAFPTWVGRFFERLEVDES